MRKTYELEDGPIRTRATLSVAKSLIYKSMVQGCGRLVAAPDRSGSNTMSPTSV